MKLDSHLAAAKSLQSCPTLCDPTDGSPPGSPVPGILQARTLEWVAISFSNAWKWKVKVKSLSRARLLMTPWIAAHQTPPSMGFSRQVYWSGVPLPSLQKTYYLEENHEDCLRHIWVYFPFLPPSLLFFYLSFIKSNITLSLGIHNWRDMTLKLKNIESWEEWV